MRKMYIDKWLKNKKKTKKKEIKMPNQQFHISGILLKEKLISCWVLDEKIRATLMSIQ